jgi:hypothetical protein
MFFRNEDTCFRNEDIFSDVLQDLGVRTHSTMFFRKTTCSAWNGDTFRSAMFFRNEDTFGDVLQE